MAHTSSFPLVPGPGDIVQRLCRDHGMARADGFSVGQQNCVSIISAIRIASLLMSREKGIENVLIASGDQIRSEIDAFRLLGTTAVQSDGGSAMILSRQRSDTSLKAAFNFSDTASWLGRLDDVESNRSFFLFNVRLIRRLLKDADIAGGEIASCITPNINRSAWPHVLQSLQIDPQDPARPPLAHPVVGHETSDALPFGGDDRVHFRRKIQGEKAYFESNFAGA